MAENKFSDLRGEIDRLISSSSVEHAAARIDTLWRHEPSPASAAFIVSRIEKLRDRLNLLPFRVAIVRSFTLEPAVPLLRAAAFRYRIDLQVHIGDFNAYAQEILDKESSLYRFAPNVVILAVRTADIAPDLWQEYSALTPSVIHDASQRVCSTLAHLIASFRGHSQAALIVHTLEQPPRATLGVLDSQLEIGQSDAIQTMNRELRRIAREHRGVHILDYDTLIARHGRLRWQDERKLLSVGLPIAAPQLIHLANEWLRLLIPLSGKTAKALVVDLDNTLWGGVIGEDGMSGIKLGTEYPGAAYQLLQRALLDLSRKGILLAVCSKNNPDDAMEVLEKHPGMLLRPANFAAMRINWNDKPQGLREIAAELNIGLDSLAFLDDNPFEREQVRATLPEVLVMDLPQGSTEYDSMQYESMKADPMQYAAVVRDCPAFERLTLSVEDRERSVLYAEQRERARAEQNFSSKEDFCSYLQQEAEIAPVVPTTLARISQLTQKTNQFNLTTRRYGEQQVAELAARPGCQVLSIGVKDRFGDHGLVGVAITCDEGDTCAIDTFLLSCRVIGRSVEAVLLSHLARNAKARGCKRLTGWFLPTKKNAPAKDFYRHNGFECQTQNGDGSLWVLDLQKQQVSCPDWIRLNVVGLSVVNGGGS
jgi:FkbH-like protein